MATLSQDDLCAPCVGGVPTISSISPSTVTAESPDTTITVTGTNYRLDSTVIWNGVALATVYVSATELTAVIPASFLLTIQTASIQVYNPPPGCGMSAGTPFNVTCVGGVPTISSLSPSTANAGDPGFTLTVNGTNYRPDSIVRWAGSARTTVYVSTIQLTATILAADIAAAGSFNVTVFNPAPGCGESAPSPFVVSSPAGAIIGATLESGTSSNVTCVPQEYSYRIPPTT